MIKLPRTREDKAVQEYQNENLSQVIPATNITVGMIRSFQRNGTYFEYCSK